ncbi:orotidine 5'-phosphate decarboxylase [Patescibacteria group bacterium]|nr:orotidine 5'-phosphate decarboxylase [Patescibacteria group bacterium]MCL5798082.1 orotidine 5'-phosphate decarboxylase [Patescibacteria group bacterium]
MLDRKKRYLQIALNSTLNDAYNIIQSLPASDRIIIEAGTPLIKRYGMEAIASLYRWWGERLEGLDVSPYIVADLKTMDRAETEVNIAKNAGASAAVSLGWAPVETINSFIESCKREGLDSMLDMMNVEESVKVLRKLKKLPDVVLLHRGVDEEKFNRDKPIPYIQINKIHASYNLLLSIAGGDTIREVQRAVFNDADIVVVWKEFYQSTADTSQLAEEFLKAIK